MINKLCRCCNKKQRKTVELLLLGLKGCGKTEIGHLLTGEQRKDYTATYGVKIFKLNTDYINLKIVEIGGDREFQKIWHNYYHRAMGIIYVMDISDYSNLHESNVLLHRIMLNNSVRGKPILLIANKVDLIENFNVLDFYELNDIESIANYCRSHLLVKFTETTRDSNELSNGFDWLIMKILNDYHVLRNRVTFDTLTMKQNSLDRNKSVQRTKSAVQRFHTALKTPKRSRSAPSTGRLPRNKVADITLQITSLEISENGPRTCDQSITDKKDKNSPNGNQSSFNDENKIR